MKSKPWNILLLIYLLFLPTLTLAQSGERATLAPIQTDAYPQMSTFLDVYDASGRFKFGLKPEDISLTENGESIPDFEFEELSPGVQVVVAFNTSPNFAIRDEVGNSRFDYLSQALIQWGKNLSDENIDDLSLITNDEIEITHIIPEIWTQTLEVYQPEARETSSNFSTLSHAIDVASDPPPQDTMKKVVIFLTPPPEAEEIIALQSLSEYALERQVRLYIWMVAPQEDFNTIGAEQLRLGAESTGGDFFAFSGGESIPSLESYLAPLRGTYALAYRSNITTSGTHTLEANIPTGTGEILATREFQLEVEAPNPIFVSPPLEIIREKDESTLGGYIPTSQILSIIIEFPDQHPRPLQETILYVDGVETAKNTAPPFDQFEWDISNYEDIETHYLKVKVVDSLGLSKTSPETAIKVGIDKFKPKMGELGRIMGEQPYAIAGLGAIVFVAVLLLIFLRRGMIQPRAFQRVVKKPQSNGKSESEPSEKKAGLTGRKNISSWINKLSWPESETLVEKEPAAILEPLTEQAKKLFSEPIPLYEAEMTFGKDSAAATVLVKEPSVSGLHARLEFVSENIYQLSDEGSVAGTWVNYQPIETEKLILHHGDIIHIGRAGFLFRIQDSSTHPEIVVRTNLLQEDKI